MQLSSKSIDRIFARRRIAVRVGLASLVVLTGAACIFDKGGDYKGGGRRGQGAELGTAKPDPTDEPPIEDAGTTDPFADVLTGSPVGGDGG